MSDEPNVTVTDRGFQHMDPIPGTYGGEVKVYESSAASGPHVWLNTWSYENPNTQSDRVEATVHLRLVDAERLRDQLSYLIDNHYQVRDDDPETQEAVDAAP